MRERQRLAFLGLHSALTQYVPRCVRVGGVRRGRGWSCKHDRVTGALRYWLLAGWRAIEGALEVGRRGRPTSTTHRACERSHHRVEGLPRVDQVVVVSFTAAQMFTPEPEARVWRAKTRASSPDTPGSTGDRVSRDDRSRQPRSPSRESRNEG